MSNIPSWWIDDHKRVKTQFNNRCNVEGSQIFHQCSLSPGTLESPCYTPQTKFHLKSTNGYKHGYHLLPCWAIIVAVEKGLKDLVSNSKIFHVMILFTFGPNGWLQHQAHGCFHLTNQSKLKMRFFFVIKETVKMLTVATFEDGQRFPTDKIWRNHERRESSHVNEPQ